MMHRITASLQRPAKSKISVRRRTAESSVNIVLAAISAWTSYRSYARSLSGHPTSATAAKIRSAARQTVITTGP